MAHTSRLVVSILEAGVEARQRRVVAAARVVAEESYQDARPSKRALAALQVALFDLGHAEQELAAEQERA